ncbi:MAG: glycerophosphodiester phosphodiesterase [Rhodospirillaceae bacterium]|jgi:glycerophosphoryl diester phosphodiesterase|nr:glycerophosphodiester phosphodiesterase [Rhodospirillaceae bacterium]MBT3911229.1 glycerophosphodiester phosphodiesterase [Rhodospirillaceae bacterium]MBT5299457.1 glycerophosphodiester phosphodiesterase [Rhodospirillaceae bacterium]MBT5515415.1 glycerophosphodiester phosphodiesterase [Rhodospirillaceae bacterium]MBT6085820.1 glycerophosphodiester phosphodiesterase [Rhodospirillaceae bacterium]
MAKGYGLNRFSAHPDALRVIGHRGAAGHAPENTLASLRKAAELGVRWVEFDVMLSGDGVPVLFHDDKLARTTNGRGWLAGHDLAALKRLDSGSWFGPRFAGEPIATLSEALVVLSELGLGANIEVKPSTGLDSETGRVVGAALKGGWPAGIPAPVISSFSTEALRTFADAAPEFSRALLVWPVPHDWRKQLDDLGCQALHCLSRRLREARAREIIAAGYALRCFTVNNPRRAQQLFKWGVDGVFSDYPDRILKIA